MGDSRPHSHPRRHGLERAGASLHGSGGSYIYLREGFGREALGRLMAFLFIWQFILSGPLEIASGYIGFASYFGYIWKDMPAWGPKLIVIIVGLLNIALLYRRITHIGKITVSLWIGTLITTGAVIFTGALHFDSKIAFDFPPDAFKFSMGFLLGLGAASRVGVYDYLGYYDICYIGDEVKKPGKTIPRSIIISVIAVALIYILINLSIIGIVPWREFVPASEKPASQFGVSLLMEKIYATKVASIVTVMILWTAFGSVFALLLGYSRIPFAAARDGYFFKIFSKLHPKHNFPSVSLLVIGGISILCSFLSLGLVIDVLIATRIIVQFIGQIFAVSLLRKNHPNLERPYKIWLYPIPSFLAFIGWVFVFATSGKEIILFSLGALALGISSYFIWSRQSGKWPFATAARDR
ncbi:MAG: amino acid permease [Acidobacteria bacterium]|nr:amino acid permease [Acidobacteriota bacterium]